MSKSFGELLPPPQRGFYSSLEMVLNNDSKSNDAKRTLISSTYAATEIQGRGDTACQLD